MGGTSRWGHYICVMDGGLSTAYFWYMHFWVRIRQELGRGVGRALCAPAAPGARGIERTAGSAAHSRKLVLGMGISSAGPSSSFVPAELYVKWFAGIFCALAGFGSTFSCVSNEYLLNYASYLILYPFHSCPFSEASEGKVFFGFWLSIFLFFSLYICFSCFHFSTHHNMYVFNCLFFCVPFLSSTGASKEIHCVCYTLLRGKGVSWSWKSSVNLNSGVWFFFF